MRAPKRKWNFIFVSLLIVNSIHSLNITDFGLPRTNHCIFSYNQSVYVIGGQTTAPNSVIKITFHQPLNATPPTITSKAIDLFYNKSTICSVTSSGKVIVATMDSLNLIDIDTLKVTENVTNNNNEGVKLNGLEHIALMSFNDEFIMLLSNDTYIMDTRSTDVWSQVPTINADSAPSPIITSISTSRWILHFRSGPTTTTTPQTPNPSSPTLAPHNIDIYLFDPIQLQWLGKVAQLVDAPNDAISIISSGLTMDSLVVYANDKKGTTRFWRLYVSSTTPSIEINDAWNAQISLPPSSSSITTSTNDNNTVMIYNNNLPVFFNTASYTLLPQPSWLQTNKRDKTPPIAAPGSPVENRNILGILLGSVLGGAAFLGILLCMLYLFKRRRAKKADDDDEKNKCDFESRPYEEYTKDRQMSSTSPISETTASQILLATPKTQAFTSRFKEHFDIASLPDLKRASTCSLHHTVSTHSTIPRSISSHM
ncbi:hypothetical protein K501DRAFT_309476 [Backusella circina FSU 941]|nr:hypothetical protein K501DRAFT_309476 [Backusella circina FSU 941]